MRRASRHRDFPCPHPSRRIVLLGDSIVFGPESPTRGLPAVTEACSTTGRSASWTIVTHGKSGTGRSAQEERSATARSARGAGGGSLYFVENDALRQHEGGGGPPRGERRASGRPSSRKSTTRFPEHLPRRLGASATRHLSHPKLPSVRWGRSGPIPSRSSISANPPAPLRVRGDGRDHAEAVAAHPGGRRGRAATSSSFIISGQGAGLGGRFRRIQEVVRRQRSAYDRAASPAPRDRELAPALGCGFTPRPQRRLRGSPPTLLLPLRRTLQRRRHRFVRDKVPTVWSSRANP
jgi:hypothetical protein